HAAREALSAGWSYSELARFVRTGRFHRLTAGVYAPSAHWLGLDKRERHLAEARAQLLTRQDSWAVARRTAAGLHGWPLLGPLPKEPQLLRPWTGSERASSRFARVATL